MAEGWLFSFFFFFSFLYKKFLLWNLDIVSTFVFCFLFLIWVFYLFFYYFIFIFILWKDFDRLSQIHPFWLQSFVMDWQIDYIVYLQTMLDSNGVISNFLIYSSLFESGTVIFLLITILTWGVNGEIGRYLLRNLCILLVVVG